MTTAFLLPVVIDDKEIVITPIAASDGAAISVSDAGSKQNGTMSPVPAEVLEIQTSSYAGTATTGIHTAAAPPLEPGDILVAIASVGSTTGSWGAPTSNVGGGTWSALGGVIDTGLDRVYVYRLTATQSTSEYLTVSMPYTTIGTASRGFHLVHIRGSSGIGAAFTGASNDVPYAELTLSGAKSTVYVHETDVLTAGSPQTSAAWTTNQGVTGRAWHTKAVNTADFNVVMADWQNLPAAQVEGFAHLNPTTSSLAFAMVAIEFLPSNGFVPEVNATPISASDSAAITVTDTSSKSETTFVTKTASDNLEIGMSYSRSLAITYAPQILRPNGAGTVSGVWTGTWDDVNEVIPNDADFIASDTNPGVTDYYSMTLDDPVTPIESGDHILRFRYSKDANAGRNIALAIQVRQGDGTVIAELDAGIIPDTTWRQAEYTLTPAEVANITDYSDIRIRFNPTASGGGAGRAAELSWLEFQVPAQIAVDPIFGSDTNELAVTETSSIVPAFSTSDTAAVSVAETTSTFATVSASDSAAISVAETNASSRTFTPNGTPVVTSNFDNNISGWQNIGTTISYVTNPVFSGTHALKVEGNADVSLYSASGLPTAKAGVTYRQSVRMWIPSSVNRFTDVHGNGQNTPMWFRLSNGQMGNPIVDWAKRDQWQVVASTIVPVADTNWESRLYGANNGGIYYDDYKIEDVSYADNAVLSVTETASVVVSGLVTKDAGRFRDTFNRHPNGALTGKTLTTGQTWLSLPKRPTAQIVNGVLKGSGTRTMSYVDTGVVNHSATGTVATGGGQWSSLGVRADATGYQYITEHSTGSLYFEVLDGASGASGTVIAGPFSNTLTDGHVHRFEAVEEATGTRLNYYSNDVIVGTYLHTAAGRPMGTYVGIGSEQDAGWSDFAFDGSGDSAAITVVETSSVFISEPATDKAASDTAAISVSDASSLFNTLPASDTASLSVGETIALTKNIVASDTSAITVTETRTTLSSLSRTDTAAVSVSETTALFKQVAATDSATIAVTDVGNVGSTLPGADSASLAVGEAVTIAVTLSAVDSAAIAVGETAGSYSDRAASDTSAISIAETASVAVTQTASDTSALSVTDTSAFVVSQPVVVSDTVSVTATETTSLFKTIVSSDSASLSVTETTARFVTKTASDTSALTATESRAQAVSLSANDTAMVAVVDTAATFKQLSVSDTAALTVTESSNAGTSLPGTDSVALGVTDTSSVATFSTTSDTAAISVGESVQISVTLAASDTSVIAVTDAGARTTENFLSAFDTSALTATETRAIAAALSSADTEALTVIESSAIFKTVVAADSGSVAVIETAGNAVTQSATDLASVSVIESVHTFKTVSASDSDALTVYEFIFSERTITASDEGSIAVTEISGKDTALPGTESTGLGVSEQVSIFVTVSTADAGAVAVNDTPNTFVALNSTDTASISVAEQKAFVRPLSASDTISISVTDVGVDEVIAAEEVSDAASVSVTETSSVVRLLSSPDAATISVSESRSQSVTLSASDAAGLSVAEARTIAVPVSAADTSAIAVTDVASANSNAPVAAMDAGTLGVQESVQIRVTQSASDSMVLAVVESTDSFGSRPGSDSLIIGLTESTNIFVTISASDSASVFVSDQASINVPVEALDNAAISVVDSGEVLAREANEVLVVVYVNGAWVHGTALQYKNRTWVPVPIAARKDGAWTYV